MLVYCVGLYFLVKLDSASGLFKEHIDLQKITEIMFQNERYNVLKPTIHTVKDHFVEFIQKRHNKDSSERIFLDRNGFRHIWEGLELPRLRSLRKADIHQKAIDDKVVNETNSTVSNNTTTSNDISTINNKNMNITDTRDEPGPNKVDARRTVVKTTFFCPFFGVVRMTTHLNKFDEKGNTTRR